MPISVHAAQHRFRQCVADEQKSFVKYMRTYTSKEKTRNKDRTIVDRGTLNSEWKPSDLENMNIMIIGENGVGDEILTSACLPELQSCCRHVVWRCDAKLKTLFQRSFPSAEFISTADLSPLVDGTIYSWELIKHFRPTLDTFQ